jgi:anion-transporting  ArsA/GET3 family ATPase
VNIAELLEDRRVCVCAGSGGVGKTSTAAAIALGMAAGGRKVAVVTIDPAPRLATALGVEQLSNEPRLVDSQLLGPAGTELKGELWAMMLDPKRTFDELIDRVAPTAERAGEIKDNRVYRELSTAVSGSQEFSAVSKLFELVQESDFDLVVLDTPPSRSALEFLEAPRRLTAFLEGRMLKALLRPTGLGMRMLSAGAAPLLVALRRLTGVQVIADVTGFFALLGDMTETFSVRARHVEALLRSPETAFVLVTSAQSEPVSEAIWFGETLRAGGLPFAGVVVNRFHHDLRNRNSVDGLVGALAEALGHELAARVITNLADYHVLAERDAVNVARLRAALGSEPLLLVPQFDEDIHDVEGLLRMRKFLFAADEESARLISDAVS